MGKRREGGLWVGSGDSGTTFGDHSGFRMSGEGVVEGSEGVLDFCPCFCRIWLGLSSVCRSEEIRWPL